MKSLALAVTFWIILLTFGVWATLALWVQFPQARLLVLPVLAGLLGVVIWQRLSEGWSWAALAILVLMIGGWYASLTPRQDRDWAPDVARIVKGQVNGTIVDLENVRAFRWDTADHASVQEWTKRRVDLSRLVGADMITSAWGNPDIAHLLVSFRFADQDPVTFSVEIRREKGENFSALGGFFRQFELSLIAADEADIVQWRAVPREEEVRLYPLNLTKAQARQVFLEFVHLGNELNEKPRWYNTVTANCVTVVWRLAGVLSPDLPLDASLMLPGRLPQYLLGLKALAGSGTLQERRERALISPRAREMPAGENFSAWIRKE